MPEGGGPENQFPPGLMQDWFGSHVFTKLDPHHLWFWLAMLVTGVLFFALLYGLQQLGSAARRRLTVVCTFLAGLFYLFTFILPPGDKGHGKAVIGGQTHDFQADMTWSGSPDDDQAGGDDAAAGDDQAKGGDDAKAPATPPPPPPPPGRRLLHGKILLTPLAATKDEAAKPQEFVDFVRVEGQQQPNGSWDLKLFAEPDAEPVTLTAQGGGYGFTFRGQAGTLNFRPQPALNVVKAYETPLGNFMVVMGGFLIGLGLLNLCALHGSTLVRGAKGWHNALAFFVGLLGMTVFGIWQMQLPPVDKGAAMPLAKAGYEFFFTGLLQPLQSTTFALLGFFIVSAAYRAFRIRSTEAALMTVIAFLVMMGQVPFGQYLTAWIPPEGQFAWLRIERITNWLLTSPNSAATRGILFGAATGNFALSLRVWLSLERGSYFGKDF
jgi:hypothetical protein